MFLAHLSSEYTLTLFPRSKTWGPLLIVTLLCACDTANEPTATCSSPLAHCRDAALQDAARGDGVLTDLQSLGADLLPGIFDSARLPDQEKTAEDARYTHEDLTVQEVYAWINSPKEMFLLDVREVSEFVDGHLAKATNLPWTSGVLQAQFQTLPTNQPIVVYCRSGNRSNSATNFLTSQGFRPVYDMLGGILAWESAGYPIEK